jgi:NADPH2:quinone reductase
VRAVVYSRHGDSSVLQLEDRPVPEPDRGELRVRVVVSGVNPTDWKSRSGVFGTALTQPTVPNHDGAGTVDAVGPAVDGFRVGDRVWLTLAGDGRPASGTAQEFTVVPAARVFHLTPQANFDLGASIGIPGATAHRALTIAEDGPTRLHPNALQERTVLVAGGAGAVGNAAIQLARWAGATVIATVSSGAKAQLARAAGADVVVNYRDIDAAQQVRQVAPDGVDLIVEVAAGTNAELDLRSLNHTGRFQFMQMTAVPTQPRRGPQHGIQRTLPICAAVHGRMGSDRGSAADINQAVADGALRVGEQAGLPLSRFPLDEAAAAHAAVEKGTVGKVLMTLSDDSARSPR